MGGAQDESRPGVVVMVKLIRINSDVMKQVDEYASGQNSACT